MAVAANLVASAKCEERNFAARDAAFPCRSRRQFKRTCPLCLRNLSSNNRKQSKLRLDSRGLLNGPEPHHVLQRIFTCTTEKQSASPEIVAHHDDQSGTILTTNEEMKIASNCSLPIEDSKEGSLQHCNSSRRELLLGTVLSGIVMTVSFHTRKALAATVPIPAVNKEASSDAVSIPSADPAEKPSGSRIYDATVLGEPFAVGKDKGRVWQKILAARVVYLGESESVPDPDDKVLEVEIVKTIRDKCFEQQRPVSLAVQAFPCTLQSQLNAYMSKRRRMKEKDDQNARNDWLNAT